MSRTGRPNRAAAIFAVGATVALATACASDVTPASDPGDYRVDLTAICVASSAERLAIADPVDDAGVAIFARSVADVLQREADAARALQAPEELDDDHRAFVQNTADQAERWVSLATTPSGDTDQFGALQTDILELTLGRDDLATAMDVAACRVSAV